jgi:mono/diheme cytochrome c family protein
MRLLKQLAVVALVLAILGGVLMLFTMDVIKIDWVVFMEIQPSFRSMENPLPLPERSVPITGAAFVPGAGAPINPVAADELSIARGKQLYDINCALCHGAEGQGNGLIAAFIQNKPADLTSAVTQDKSDGTLFTTISNGSAGKMPALNENLLVRDRWDLVNFIRSLVAQ